MTTRDRKRIEKEKAKLTDLKYFTDLIRGARRPTTKGNTSGDIKKYQIDDLAKKAEKSGMFRYQEIADWLNNNKFVTDNVEGVYKALFAGGTVALEISDSDLEISCKYILTTLAVVYSDFSMFMEAAYIKNFTELAHFLYKFGLELRYEDGKGIIGII